MAASHAWAFRASFRRDAFGWSGTRKAIERLNEAVGEIERVARADPVLADEGAVLLPPPRQNSCHTVRGCKRSVGGGCHGGATL